MKGIKAVELYEALEEEFRPWECTEVFPKKGLQFHHTDWIEKVYTSTFVGEEVLDQLKQKNARRCMLFTHHPVPQRSAPWEKPPAIPQEHLAFLQEQEITLFSYHIPLDRNGPYSPGASLAKALGGEIEGEFYQQNQVLMGVLCRFPSTRRSDLCEALEKTLGNPIACYPYGPEELSGGRFAIMAGGAKDNQIYRQLRGWGVDAFITGVTNRQVPWVEENHRAAMENQVSLIGGTHCATEKFAPMAMVQFFCGLGLEAEFLSETPHLNEL